MVVIDPPNNDIAVDPRHVKAQYDAAVDTFYVRLSDRRAVADPLESQDDVWLFRDAETDGVIGFFIEDFERSFVKRHPELLRSWSEARQPWRRWSPHVQHGIIRLILDWATHENSEVKSALASA